MWSLRLFWKFCPAEGLRLSRSSATTSIRAMSSAADQTVAVAALSAARLRVAGRIYQMIYRSHRASRISRQPLKMLARPPRSNAGHRLRRPFEVSGKQLAALARNCHLMNELRRRRRTS